MSSAAIDAQRVRRLFSQPDAIAASEFIRREIAARMLEKLELVKIQPQQILDAGCGSGADVRVLQTQYESARVLGVDAAAPMLQRAQVLQQTGLSSLQRVMDKLLPGALRKQQNANWVCADFSRLPLADSSLDMVWSNLALHWHAHPDLVFAEWRRVLRRDGLLMFSCFGPDSLQELRLAFDGIDAYQHALPFVDMHDYGDMLGHAGFATPVMDMEKITLTYATVEKLFQEVRALGGNPLLAHRLGLLGKQAWRRIRAALEQQRRPDGRIPLTLEVIYGHAFRPVQRQLANGEAIVRMDFKKK